VTAMRMIDATTGLRAFLLLVFIFLFIPPFGISMYGRGGDRFKSYDLLHNIRCLQETVEHQYSQIKRTTVTTIKETSEKKVCDGSDYLCFKA
jgi:hypothetical protein